MLTALLLMAITGGPNAPLTIQWDANTEPDMSHYNLYYDGVKVAQVPHENADVTMQAPPPSSEGDHTVWVTAVDTSNNESGPSNTVTFTWDSGAPAAPVITITIGGTPQ